MIVPSKCDVIRDTVRAAQSGACGGPSQPAVCEVPTAANLAMRQFATRWQTAGAVKTQTEKNYEESLLATRTKIYEAYPGISEADTEITWPDFQRCLWNADGRPGGFYGNKYFGRGDLQSFGMSPVYPAGGDLLSNSLWKTASPLPVRVDYVMNPDLFAVAVFALVVLVFLAVLIGSRRPPTARERCLAYVEKMERAGYDVSKYRERCEGVS